MRLHAPPGGSDVRATAWGYVLLDRATHRALTASRADVAAGFVDLGLADVVTVGTSGDGSIALIATASGEVFSLTASLGTAAEGDTSSPTTLVSLGRPASWEYTLAGLGQTWITVSREGLVVWLVQSGTPRLYLRRIDRR